MIFKNMFQTTVINHERPLYFFVALYLSIFCLYSTIDLLDWNSLIDDRTNSSDLLVVPNVKVSNIKHFTMCFREHFTVKYSGVQLK